MPLVRVAKGATTSDDIRVRFLSNDYFFFFLAVFFAFAFFAFLAILPSVVPKKVDSMQVDHRHA